MHQLEVSMGVKREALKHSVTYMSRSIALPLGSLHSLLCCINDFPGVLVNIKLGSSFLFLQDRSEFGLPFVDAI
jgi:hypothetical protein